MGLSFTHLLLIAVILLIFFGPSRLPSLGRSLGEAIRGFKKGISELDESGQSRDVTSSAKKEELKDKSETTHT